MTYSRTGNHIEKKYSPSQERDDRGRFGTSSSQTHESRQARAASAKVSSLQKAGARSRDIATAHRQAASAHSIAAFSASTSQASTAHANAAAYHRTQAQWLG